MKTSLFLLLVSVAVVLPICADESTSSPEDSFAPEKRSAPEELRFSGGITGCLTVGNYPEKVPLDHCPKHLAPTALNNAFERPSAVWTVDGGFFVAYDGGEFGSALFFLPKGKQRLQKIAGHSVKSLERLGGGVYIAAGGLAHMDFSGGSVFLCWVDDNLRWRSRLVLKASTGIPLTRGLISEESSIGQERALIVVSERSESSERADTKVEDRYFAIDREGVVETLGKLEKRSPIVNKSE